MNLRSQSQSTSSGARTVELSQSSNANAGGRGNENGNNAQLKLKAYIIPDDQEEAEIAQNRGRPTSDFLLVNDEPVEVQEFKLREFHRRFSAMEEKDVYQSQLLSEFESMKKKMRLEDPVDESPVGTAGVIPGRKATSHFNDRDGKFYISFNRDITRSTVEYAMPFLRMAHSGRVLDVCVDELHICLNIAHARSVYLSKVNMHTSLLASHWESINLWGSIENLSVMRKDKFFHVLLFDGNYEELEEFSLANFLLNPSSLTNLVYLREALDNLELVYRCVMGDMYVGMASAAKDFLMNNSRILSTRNFDFVRGVFEGAFVRFQMDLKARDVSTGATPLNTSVLVLDFFQQCFSFPLEMFSRDEEDMFKARLAARRVLPPAKPFISSKPTTGKGSVPKGVSAVSRPHRMSTSNPGQSYPCIAHLAQSLGISKLAGRTIIPCALGPACRYEHLVLPLLDNKRIKVVDFVKNSGNSFLRAQADKDMVLSRI